MKHHHRPAPRLRFVPPKEKNRPLMRGGLCWTSPSLAAGCTTDSSTPVGAHTLYMEAGSESPPVLRSSYGRTILLCSYHNTSLESLLLPRGAGSLNSLKEDCPKRGLQLRRLPTPLRRLAHIGATVYDLLPGIWLCFGQGRRSYTVFASVLRMFYEFFSLERLT